VLAALTGTPVTSKTSRKLSVEPAAPAEKMALQPPPPLGPHVLQTVVPWPSRPPSQRVAFAVMDHELDMMAVAAFGRE
jgi:hypothetical protein